MSTHRAVLERLAEHQGEHQEDDTHDGGFADAAHRAAPHFVDVEAHTQRDGDREADREDTPGRLGERADDDLAEPGQGNDDDEEDGEPGDDAEHGAELLVRDFGERPPAPPDRRDKNDEVMDGAAEHDTEEDPRVARQKPELGGQHGPDERTGSGDRGEVMSEQHPAVRRMEVLPVAQGVRGRRAPVR